MSPELGDRAFFWPDPPKDGDPGWSDGEIVGEIHGDYTQPGGWYVVTGPRKGGAA